MSKDGPSSEIGVRACWLSSLIRMPMKAVNCRDDLPPRLYFESPSLKQSMLKLAALMITPLEHEQTYAEHIGLVILCELRDALIKRREAQAFRGGLTARQLNHVRDYTTAKS